MAPRTRAMVRLALCTVLLVTLLSVMVHGQTDDSSSSTGTTDDTTTDDTTGTTVATAWPYLDLPTVSGTWVAIEPIVSVPDGYDSTNTPIGARGPQGRCHAQVANVPARSETLLWGGQIAGDPTGTPVDDMWSFTVPSSGSPTFTYLPVNATSVSTPAARFGAAFDYLADFGIILMFGGMTQNYFYLDDVQIYDIATNTWTELMAATTPSPFVTACAMAPTPSCPFARAAAGWRRTSDSATVIDSTSSSYNLVLYGGRGDSYAQGTYYDQDADDLWGFQLVRTDGVYTGAWTALEPRVCAAGTSYQSCSDSIALTDRYPDLGTALNEFSSALSSSTYRPSQLLDLLASLRTASTDISTSTTDALNQFAALAPANQVNDDTLCTDICPQSTPDLTNIPIHPGGVEGARVSRYNDTFVYFGGYSALQSGLHYYGGSDNYNTLVYFLNITTNEWTVLAPPVQDTSNTKWPKQFPAEYRQILLWPKPRAYHTQFVRGNQLWIYGGQFKGVGNSLLYYNDVSVLDLDLQLWLPMAIRGSLPLPSFSSALLFPQGEQTIMNEAYLVGGCNDDAFLDTVHQLRFERVQPENVFLSGPALESNITAGQETWFLIETRAVSSGGLISSSNKVSTSSSSSIKMMTSGRKTVGRKLLAAGVTDTRVAGALLPWGTSLQFRVQLINETRGLTSGAVVELGGGRYNASYTLTAGYSFQLFVLLDGTVAVADTPVTLYSTPQLASATYVAVSANPTIKGESAFAMITLYDQLSNALRTGGSIVGALALDSDQIANPAASNVLTLAVYPHKEATFDGWPSTLNSNPSGATVIESVMDYNNGSYLVRYAVPDGDFDAIKLFFYLNGESFSSGRASTILPVELVSYSQSVTNPELIKAGQGLISICMIIVAIYMVILTKHSDAKVIKASSYFFLMTLCVGAEICFIAAHLLAVTNDNTCRAYPIVLGFGYILLIGSLFVKSQRIMAIFTTKKLQVLNLSNLKTGIPIIVLLVIELIFSIAWLASDPMKHVGEPNVNNQYQTYDHCDSKHKAVWVAFTMVEKCLLGAYGVFLATKTRNVPKAYNESKQMAFGLYNLGFTILIGFLLIYLTEPNDDLDTPYMTQVIVILWCCMWTVSSLIVPRIYYLVYPPGADFFQAQSKKSAVSQSGSQRGNSSSIAAARKVTTTDRPPASSSASPRPPASSVARKPTTLSNDGLELQAVSSSSSSRPPAISTGTPKLPRKVSLVNIDLHIPPPVDVAALAEAGMQEHAEHERRSSKIGAGLLGDQYGSSSTPPDTPPPPQDDDRHEGQRHDSIAPPPPPMPVAARPPPPHEAVTPRAALSPAEMDSDSSSDDEDAPPPPAPLAPPPVVSPVSPLFSLRAQPHRPSISSDQPVMPPPPPPPPSHAEEDEDDLEVISGPAPPSPQASPVMVPPPPPAFPSFAPPPPPEEEFEDDLTEY